jgi:hypothetical protein
MGLRGGLLALALLATAGTRIDFDVLFHPGPGRSSLVVSAKAVFAGAGAGITVLDFPMPAAANQANWPIAVSVTYPAALTIGAGVARIDVLIGANARSVDIQVWGLDGMRPGDDNIVRVTRDQAPYGAENADQLAEHSACVRQDLEGVWIRLDNCDKTTAAGQPVLTAAELKAAPPLGSRAILTGYVADSYLSRHVRRAPCASRARAPRPYTSPTRPATPRSIWGGRRPTLRSCPLPIRRRSPQGPRCGWRSRSATAQRQPSTA